MKKKMSILILAGIALMAIVSGFAITREVNVSEQFRAGIQSGANEERDIKRTGGAINFTSPLLEQYNRD